MAERTAAVDIQTLMNLGHSLERATELATADQPLRLTGNYMY